MYHKCGLKERNQMIATIGSGKASDKVKYAFMINH